MSFLTRSVYQSLHARCHQSGNEFNRESWYENTHFVALDGCHKLVSFRTGVSTLIRNRSGYD